MKKRLEDNFIKIIYNLINKIYFYFCWLDILLSYLLIDDFVSIWNFINFRKVNIYNTFIALFFLSIIVEVYFLMI
jgi:hypothetical protein